MIIQIALGIVLAVLILAFLPELVALGIAGVAAVVTLVAIVGFLVWLPKAFGFAIGTALFSYVVWIAIRHSKKHNEKDAQDLQLDQGKSATGLTWIESASNAERNKHAFQVLFFGGGFAILCFVFAHRLGWGPLWGLGFIILPFSIYLSLYTKRRLTNRCYATTPRKVLFRTRNVPTSEALEEGRGRGWK